MNKINTEQHYREYDNNIKSNNTLNRTDWEFNGVGNNTIYGVLFCIHAWHEMINPGHHYVELYSDGSGRVIAALNAPIRHSENIEIICEFASISDFVETTYAELRKCGIKVI